MGLERTYRYYQRRVTRLPGTAYSIAAGFAAGAAVSFTPLVGFHFLLGALVAFLIRGNLIASAFGTLVGNPWTFPFIWVAIYKLGTSIMPGPAEPMPVREFDWAFLMANFSEVLVPMLLGGLILSLVVWPIVYFPMYRLVARLKAAQAARRMRKLRAAQTAGAGEAA
ncbi:MAG: DUF2062 domain-containing protein [Alphaproteobacteria bacterium]